MWRGNILRSNFCLKGRPVTHTVRHWGAASRSRFFREQGYGQVTRDVPLSKATLDAALKSAMGTRIPTPPHWKCLDPQRCVVCAQTLKRSQTWLWDIDSRTCEPGVAWTFQTIDSNKCVRRWLTCRITNLLQGGTSCQRHRRCNPPGWMGPNS